MSILDDAIREHLELKRAHGADAAELKRLEDEAFGPPQRPDSVDPFAEAPTEFLGAPEGAPPASEAETTLQEPEGRRVPNIADLQEPPSFPPIEEARAEMPLPEAPEAEQPVEAPEAEAPAPAPEAEAPPVPEAPSIEETPAIEQPLPPEPPTAEEPLAPELGEPPASEEPPAPEPEPATLAAEPQPSIDAGPSTEERQAIAEQPTQFFDVEAEMESPPAEAPAPSDEELADVEAAEPRLGATPTPAPAPAPEPDLADEAPSEEYEEDDFFSEQRLSEELDQALEAPVTDEHALPAAEEPAFFDREAAGPQTEEAPAPPLAAPSYEEEPSEEHEEPISEEYEEGDTGEEEYETGEEEHEAPPAPRGEQDVLEGTPDFLEDGDDEDLWFEQRPPKDFDFDD